MLTTGLLGLLTGLIFGFVIQRGRFDMAAGFQAFYLRRDATQLKSYVLAVIIQSAALYGLIRFGVAQVPNQPFHWLAAVMGGLLFGGGMALTGSGAAGLLSRSGQGAVDAVVTILGFAIGAAAATSGALAPFVREIHTIHAEVGTVYTLLDVSLGTAVSFAAVLTMWWFSLSYRAECGCKTDNPSMLAPANLFPGLHDKRIDADLLYDIIFRRPWSWIGTGVTVGVVASLAWFTAAHSAAQGGLEVTTGTAGFLHYIVASAKVSAWHIWLVLGIPAGACAAARVAGEFQMTCPGPQEMMRRLAGGLLMGLGAVTCLGDDIAAGLTGTAFFSLTGFTATAFMFLGAWGVNQIIRASQLPK